MYIHTPPTPPPKKNQTIMGLGSQGAISALPWPKVCRYQMHSCPNMPEIHLGKLIWVQNANFPGVWCDMVCKCRVTITLAVICLYRLLGKTLTCREMIATTTKTLNTTTTQTTTATATPTTTTTTTTTITPTTTTTTTTTTYHNNLVMFTLHTSYTSYFNPQKMHFSDWKCDILIHSAAACYGPSFLKTWIVPLWVREVDTSRAGKGHSSFPPLKRDIKKHFQEAMRCYYLHIVAILIRAAVSMRIR